MSEDFSSTVDIFKLEKRFELGFFTDVWPHLNFRPNQLAIFINHNHHLMLSDIDDSVKGFG